MDDTAGVSRPSAWTSRGGTRRWAVAVAVAVAVGVGYACLALVGFAADEVGTAAFFPAAGLTFAAMAALSGRHRIPTVVAIVVAEIIVDRQHGVGTSSAVWFAAANVVEPLVAAWLLWRLVPRAGGNVIDPKTVAGVGFASVVSSACGAVIGATGALAAADVGWGEVFLGRWAGDLLGQLVVGPVLLVGLFWRRSVGTAGVVVAWASVLAAMSAVVFFVVDPGAEWMVLPVVAVMAIRTGSFGVAVANLVVAATTFTAVCVDRPLFTSDPAGGAPDLVMVHLFLIVAVASAHLLAADRQARADLQASLLANESVFDAVVGNAPVSIMEIDADDGNVLSWNPASEATFGWSRDEVIGRPLPIVPPELWRQHEAARMAARDDPSQRLLEVERVHRDGTRLQVSVATQPRRRSDGRVVFTSVLQDITVAKQHQQHLRHRLETDTLTGLANRDRLIRELDDRLGRERRPPAESDVGRDDRAGDRTAVLFCDLNGFKQVNDTVGHVIGDRLLQLAADRLRDLTRPEDVVARLGGDEFVVLAGVASRKGADILARRIEKAFDQPFTCDGRTIRVSISIGVAIADGESATDVILGQADAAMYDHKRSRGFQAAGDHPPITP